MKIVKKNMPCQNKIDLAAEGQVFYFFYKKLIFMHIETIDLLVAADRSGQQVDTAFLLAHIFLR